MTAPLGPLLSCPWCAAPLVERIAAAQIAHLIECGDRTNSKLAEAERAGHAAFKVLARHGFVEHAGTWVARDEAERISKDGP